jgi:hypothetical protein
MDMPGMLTDAQLKELDAARGASSTASSSAT